MGKDPRIGTAARASPDLTISPGVRGSVKRVLRPTGCKYDPCHQNVLSPEHPQVIFPLLPPPKAFPPQSTPRPSNRTVRTIHIPLALIYDSA